MEYKKLAESMSDSAKIARYFGERILLTSGSEAIKDLLSTVEELEAKNKRLEQARENANEACAKWEGLYRAELEKKSAWVSVKDRLPELINGKYAESVLVTDGEFRHIAYHYGKWFFCDSGQMKEPMFYKVTHWMPLPEPPKKE